MKYIQHLLISGLMLLTSVIQAVELSNLPSLEQLPIMLKEILAGDSVVLPCQTTYTKVNDYVLLILIYKDDLRYPIISFDRRSADPNEYKLWSEKRYNNRISVQENKKRVNVILKDVQPSDRSTYRCSVVYKSLPTKITKFYLQVIEPVQNVFITSRDENEDITNISQKKVSFGPFELGANLTLSCHVIGGYPRPNATWWNDRTLISNATERQFPDSVVSVLKVPPLTKQDNFRKLTCKGSNSKLAPPRSTFVVVEIKLPPSRIKITMDVPFSVSVPSRGPKIVSLREKRPIQLSCEVLETHLDVHVVWKKNSELIQGDDVTKLGNHQSSSNGPNVQASKLVLTPDYLDNGSVLTCQASNVKFPGKETEDSLILNVVFAPKVMLRVRGTGATDVEPGEDLYLQCQATSNPPVSTFSWMFNGELVTQNRSSGALVTASGDSLIIHDVTSNWTGQFSCSAENDEGKGSSNVLDVNVFSQKLPRCTNQNQIVHAAMNSTVELRCEIDSYPMATLFRWNFLDIPSQDIGSTWRERRTNKPIMKYSIRSPSDFRTLLCQAENHKGEMTESCIITITPEDHKTSPSNCSVTYITSEETVLFKCEDFRKTQEDPPLFHLSICKLEECEKMSAPLLNLTMPDPTFSIKGLLYPGRQYIFRIYSESEKGETGLSTYLTYRVPYNRTTTRREYTTIEIGSSPTQLTAIVLGISFTLFASPLVFICCLRYKNCRRKVADHLPEGTEDIYVEQAFENDLLTIESKRRRERIRGSPYLKRHRRFMSSGRLIIGARNESKYQISNIDSLMDLASNYDHQRRMTTTDKSHSARNEGFQNTSALQEGNSDRKIPPLISQRNSNSLNSLSTTNSMASEDDVAPALGDSLLTVVLNPLYGS